MPDWLKMRAPGVVTISLLITMTTVELELTNLFTMIRMVLEVLILRDATFDILMPISVRSIELSLLIVQETIRVPGEILMRISTWAPMKKFSYLSEAAHPVGW